MTITKNIVNDNLHKQNVFEFYVADFLAKSSPLQNYSNFLNNVVSFDLGNLQIVDLVKSMKNVFCLDFVIETNCKFLKEIKMNFLSDIHFNKFVREINTFFLKVLCKNGDVLAVEDTEPRKHSLDLFINEQKISSTLQVVPWDVEGSSTKFDQDEATWYVWVGQILQKSCEYLVSWQTSEPNAIENFCDEMRKMAYLIDHFESSFPDLATLPNSLDHYRTILEKNQQEINTLRDANQSVCYEVLDAFNDLIKEILPLIRKVVLERIYKDLKVRQESLVDILKSFLQTIEQKNIFCIAGGNHFFNREKSTLDPYVDDFLKNGDVSYMLVRYLKNEKYLEVSHSENSLINFFDLPALFTSLSLRNAIAAYIQQIKILSQGM